MIMMKKVVAYANISTSRIKKKDEADFDVTTTNAYKRTKSILEQIGYGSSKIYFDVINLYTQEKPAFSELIKNISVYDVLVILDISLLGVGQELSDIYTSIVSINKTDILIPDPLSESGISKYSTVTLDLADRKKEMNFEELLSELEKTTKSSFARFRGRAKKTITPMFINAYWLYERFLVAEPIAYEIADLNKQTFHRLASEYEKTPEYIERLNLENKKHNIISKPKRHGAVPKGFVSVIALVDKGASLESACIQSGIQPMNPIDYERYKLKYFGGRKALAKAMEY